MTDDRNPDSEFDVSQLILTLVQETRDDVRVLVQESARAQARLDALERRADAIDKRMADAPYASPPGMKRDAGIATLAATLVVTVMQILGALGIGVPAQAAPPPAPPAIHAAP
jgi:hypothetical protein